MKKILTSIMIFMGLLVLVACKDTTVKRTAPVITGLSATAEITLGESINVLAGVTAKAHGDVDITSNLVVTVNPSSATISNGLVTPEEEGSYLVTLTATDPVDSTLFTTATLFLEVNPDLSVEEVGRTVYTFDKVGEGALNGFVAKEAGNVVDALDVSLGALVYSPVVSGGGDGDNQIIKLLSLEAGATYTVTIRAKASRILNGVAFVINGKTPGEWDPYAGAWGQEVGTEYRDYKHTFAVDKDNEAAELLFNVGGQGAGAYQVFVQSLTIVSNTNPVAVAYDFLDVTSEGDGWVYVNEVGASSAKVLDGDLVIDITDPNAGIWQQKLYQEPIQLTANKVYKLSYTIHATQAIRYEFIARVRAQQSDGRDENYIWSGPNLGAGETKTITHTFTTNATDINDFDMFFQFGGQEAAVVITLSDIVITQYDGFKEDITKFSGLPTGFASYENIPGSASLYIDTQDGLLVYDVSQFGDVDWYNKVFLDNFTFNEDSKYRVEFTAYASKEVEGFFAVNPMGEWNPKVTTMFSLTTESHLFSYETPNIQAFDQRMEFLFQFGSFNTGSAVIYIEDITIIELA